LSSLSKLLKQTKMTSRLFILCGIPFSGKTVFAKKLTKKFDLIRIDLDEVKFRLFGNSIPDSKIDQSGWDKIYQLMYKKIRQALISGKTVVHDTGNFTKAERLLVKKIADDLKLKTLTIFVDTPSSLAYQRLLANRQTKKRFNVSSRDFYPTLAEMEAPDQTEAHLVYKSVDDFDVWLQKNKKIFNS